MIDIRYKDMYDRFIEHYKNVHVNPWHEIDENKLEQIYNSLINSMNVNNEYNFKYFMDYIIKRLSGKEDAHTEYSVVSLLPMNFRIFDNEVIINFPDNLKGGKLLSINGIDINKIVTEIDEITTYGTEGKRKYELEKALFNKYILFGIPSLREFNELVFEIEKIDGEKTQRKFYKNESYSKEEKFDYEKYLHGDNATYRFINNCLIYNHISVQPRYKEKIERAVDCLRKEVLTKIDTIIIDIRGNTGGNAALNKILMDFIEENNDKKLICLTDYRVFSGGRYALKDLINLGATTIGEEISTPINCYGNSNWININNHYFSSSECYFHPFKDISVHTKEDFKEKVTDDIQLPCIFKPDILIETKKQDYLLGVDTILNFALEYSANKSSEVT